MKHVGRYAYKLDIGKIRVTNEDNATALINAKGDILLCVCDGMGGYKKGDFASRIVIDHLKDNFVNKNGFISKLAAVNWISRNLKNANKEIFNYAQEADFKDMGTTVVLALIVRKSLIVVSAGDSRCYFYDNNDITQISKDQTYAEYLYQTGKINESEVESNPKRHILTNAVGIFPAVNFDINIFPYNGQNILLCSDGLYNNLSTKDIFACINTNEDVEEKVNTLIACANSNGGSDNIAVVLWESQK
jgi:serine/threonine protein phosphatase PrpC